MARTTAAQPFRKVLCLDYTLLRKVRDFRWTERVASENAAIRELIERGLAASQTEARDA